LAQTLQPCFLLRRPEGLPYIHTSTINVTPNPFSSHTTVRYSLSAESPVSLNLYDISGRLIKTLVNEHKNPGNYQLTLNANNLPAGVYFLSLEVEEKRIIERLVVIK
jgi:hypothetical protein